MDKQNPKQQKTTPPPKKNTKKSPWGGGGKGGSGRRDGYVLPLYLKQDRNFTCLPDEYLNKSWYIAESLHELKNSRVKILK